MRAAWFASARKISALSTRLSRGSPSCWPTTRHATCERQRDCQMSPASECPRRSHDVEVARQSGSVRETDIRLYIIQVGSALLNHLQCSWSTELLSSTLELAGSRRVGKTGDRGIETEYRRYKRQLLGPLDDAGHSPALLQNLQRHPDLKKAFWKDRTLFHFLTQRLRPLLLDPANTPEAIDQRRVLPARIEELELAALLLDILLATLQDSNCISNKIQMLQFDGGSALQELLALLVTPPSIPHAYRNACSRMLEDFHEFGSSGRSNLPEAELIRSLAEVTNVSTAILYELLLTLRNNSAIKLSKLLEGLNLECHLKRSVTQLLGLLFPSQPQKLKPLEAVLVYQHFFVLHSLMESISRARYYVREQFEEEFRYYAHWSRVGSKLPDGYPIKRLFQRLVEGVHRMASGGSKDKSAPSLFS
ncbi:uncharacterized protein C12orf56-like [Zootermopsis nevadensis]|uniref:uncharacterized protein C12orf56-like n=1 Tax=Zootermopsis nevadensis TaxID=136037 RepID=UPI000B8E848D|nr:uncharacterized protein C12orf56-like [Zootermopsis nevadensis]